MYLFVPELYFRSARDTADSSAPPLSLSQEFGLFVLSSGKPIRLPSSLVEWSKATWMHVLSSTIWNPSEANRIAAEWISSLPVFHVKAQASLASAVALTMSDGSGRKSGGSRAKSKRRGSSPKTSPVSSVLTVAEHSRKSSGTWARSGGLHAGIVFPLQPSVPRTSAIVSSCSLPTPTASEYGSSQNGINGKGGTNERPSAGTASLSTMARTGMPLLPTPMSSEFKRSNTDAKRQGTKGGKRLAAEAAQLEHRDPSPEIMREQYQDKVRRDLSKGKLPTPTASDAKRGAIGMSLRGHSDASLTERLSRLPTPRASDATKGSRSMPDRPGKEGPTLPEAINKLAARGMLPTPTATDCKASGTAGNWTESSGRNAGATLTDVAVRGLDTPSKASGESSTSGEPTGIGGMRLAPQFVSWMMGLPPHWVSTIPMPINSMHSATASSATKRRSRSSSSGPSSTTEQLSMFSTENDDEA